MNEKQIAFIMCVNNEQEYEEAVFYIERLYLPEGYTKDIIAIWEAPSMAAGYQAAMESSDARYKVYLHQDVFIYHRSFIEEILQIFQNDEKIGAIGMIGRCSMPEQLCFAADWDVGNILFNSDSRQLERQQYQKWPIPVDAVDGLLIATQYDVNWRADLFDGWDIYDISQCMELKRSGYQVVVPYQKQAWCYHDNTYSRLNKYFYYQEIFCREYQDMKHYCNLTQNYVKSEMSNLAEQMSKQLKVLVEMGEKQQLWEIIVGMKGTIHMEIRDFSLLAQIDHLERNNFGRSLFWQEGESWAELQRKICRVKYIIKRMEFGLEEFSDNLGVLQNEYTIFAIAAVTLQYASNRKYCVHKIGQWYGAYQIADMQDIWYQLTKDYQ